jgi:hypothetical protein
MIHPYQSRTRNRDRSRAQPESRGTEIVSWIVFAGFLVILMCVLLPIFTMLMERGQ